MCCEQPLQVYGCHQAVFHRILVAVRCNNSTHIAETAALIHNPANDINISIIRWVGTQKVLCRLDELVLY
jgi:hypothetical protein